MTNETESASEPCGGVCCNCGYGGAAETPCPYRDDDSHCEHWWDGTDHDEE